MERYLQQELVKVLKGLFGVSFSDGGCIRCRLENGEVGEVQGTSGQDASRDFTGWAWGNGSRGGGL